MLAGGSTGGSTLSSFDLALADLNTPFHPPLEPMSVTGEDSSCTSFTWYTFSTRHSYLLLSALDENQQPGFEAYSGAAIGANDGSFQAQPDNPFGPPLNFDSNAYLYGSFPVSQYPALVPVDLGGPSCARTSAQSVLYHKSEVIN